MQFLTLALLLTADFTAAEHIARGKAALATLEYGMAADELMMAAASADATDAERLDANLQAGIANRIVGRDLDARVCFRFVLLHAPETHLDPALPPKVSAFFEVVRGELLAEQAEAARAAGARAATLPVPAPSPTTNAAPASRVPAPETPADEGASSLAIGGIATSAAGACMGLGCGALAFGMDNVAGNTSGDGNSRYAALAAGRLALVGVATAVIVTGVGVGLLYMGNR